VFRKKALHLPGAKRLLPVFEAHALAVDPTLMFSLCVPPEKFDVVKSVILDQLLYLYALLLGLEGDVLYFILYYQLKCAVYSDNYFPT